MTFLRHDCHQQTFSFLTGIIWDNLVNLVNACVPKILSFPVDTLQNSIGKPVSSLFYLKLETV